MSEASKTSAVRNGRNNPNNDLRRLMKRAGKRGLSNSSGARATPFRRSQAAKKHTGKASGTPTSASEAPSQTGTADERAADSVLGDFRLRFDLRARIEQP
jgi:hypothetical protein